LAATVVAAVLLLQNCVHCFILPSVTSTTSAWHKTIINNGGGGRRGRGRHVNPDKSGVVDVKKISHRTVLSAKPPIHGVTTSDVASVVVVAAAAAAASYNGDDQSTTNSQDNINESSSMSSSSSSSSSSFSTRRNVLQTAVFSLSASTGIVISSSPRMALAEVGTLPEFSDTNAVLQGLTVNVADESQQEAMINFLINGFDFKVLRKRIRNTVEETVRFCL
jgi:hypothetical protein